MPQPEDDCPCVRDLEKREIMAGFANDVACEVADMIGGVCPPMVDYTMEELVARLAHMVVYTHDETLAEDERRAAEAVEKYLFKLSKTLPATVVRIMRDANEMEKPSNARN